MTEEVAMETDPPASEATTSGSTFPGGIPDYPPIEVPPAPETVATYDINGPRLMITQIVNENFKSYAGIQTLGPFHKSFSSIVGPNGSGKSNVIDSMLFVFGYRANKIRSKKISVLLHNSEQHRNITSCTVSVHFQKIIDTGDGENDFDVVPNSHFVVSRTAFKDNSSHYRINDKKATYKEVASLLRGSGIDLDHNRFLILQGEVEQIAMMKPKALTEHEDGMLEFLEDIIGSSRFKEPIEALANRVEELNECRGEKLNRVKAVEKEKDDLEGAKNEAVEFLTIENQIVTQKNLLFQKYIFDLNGQEVKAKEKHDEVAKGMEDLNQQVKAITDEKNEKSKEYKKLHKKYEELNKQTEDKKAEFQKFEQEDVKCRESLKHSKSKGKKLEKTLDQEKKKLEELKMIPEKTERDVQELTKKLEKLNTEKEKEEAKLAEVMESLKTETQGLQAEKEAKEQDLIGLEKTENETKSEYLVKKSEHELYLRNQNAELSKLRDTERNYERVSKTVKERKQAIKEMEKKIPQMKSDINKSRKDLEDASNAEIKIGEEVRQARVKVEQARSSHEKAKSQGTLQQGLGNLMRSGKMPGLYGRLGDLGAIDKKYDVAVSTASGAKLDHYITDTIETAQKCVEFLKAHKLGVASFTALDKQDRYRDVANRTVDTPENVPRLFDLITPKEDKFRTGFYFACGETLVANDIDQASRIAYGRQRKRVVTLSGELIETSGTMSGGGAKKKSGKMGSTIAEDHNPNELEHMEKKLRADAQEALNCREKKQALEETIHKLEKTLKELHHGVEKFTMEILSLEEQEKTLEQQIKEQKQKAKDAAPDEKELKSLEKTVDGLKKRYDKASAAASGKKDEVHELHRQIMDIGGTKMKSAQSKVNLVQTQIDQVQGHITKSNVAVKTATRNAKKTEDKVQSIEEEIKENKEKLLEYEETFKQLEKDAIEVMQGYNKSNEDTKEAASAIEEIQKQIGKLEERENKLNSENLSVKHDLEKYQQSLSDVQSKIKHWKRELKKLQFHQIEQEAVPELETISPDDLENTDRDGVMYNIEIQEGKRDQMKPNMAAIMEYRKKEEMYLRRVGELDQITELRDSQRKLHEDLRKQRLDEFMSGFTKITDKLKEMYQMITLGGDAELELVDSLDPFSEGIVFSVRPPKKSWKNISNLSGGEKTLSSLALVFALHHYKPTPLYVMDEIDAALDFKNVSIIANYIKERTRNAQFIIISLRSNMFEMADRLIGIYKTNNCTKSCPINPMKVTIPTVEQIEMSA